MKTIKIASICILMTILGCKNKAEKVADLASETTAELYLATKPDSLRIIPIEHASMVLTYGDEVIYIDPVGSPDLFSEQDPPSFVLITDIHGDHMDPTLLEKLDLANAILIIPKAVAEKLPLLPTKNTIVLNNGDTKSYENIKIEAIPMYNLRDEALKFHEKGRGNGYLLTLGNQRIYISGDTEDIPEMRSLKNIDIAFVCMNLPYTMTVVSAADAVLEFKPKTVYPYHYRGTDGMSDVNSFKTMVNNGDPEIEVVLLDWYK